MPFTYVEMNCTLDQGHYDDDLPRSEVQVDSITQFEAEQLFECYTQAFSGGDAAFYHRQNPAERRRYFDEELGFPDVLSHPASFAFLEDGNLIGFALVMDYLESNFHISCMCLRPEYQGCGLGKAMLNRIKNVAVQNGCRSLSLGTEPAMRAYHLYRKHGFQITAEHQVDL